MALRLRKSGPFTVMVSGMDTTVVGRAAWRNALMLVGRNIQDRIANSFAAQRTAGGQLRPNDPRYTAAKIRQGYDPRKGHRTNMLQSMLRPQASVLYVVIGPDRNGNGRIIMQEGRLQGLVPYAEYYADAKVQGAGILQVAQSWLQAVSAPLRVLEAEAAVAARQAAPFAGRAARILPALGITGRVAGSLARQATAGLSRSQAARLARLIGRV